MTSGIRLPGLAVPINSVRERGTILRQPHHAELIDPDVKRLGSALGSWLHIEATLDQFPRGGAAGCAGSQLRPRRAWARPTSSSNSWSSRRSALVIMAMGRDGRRVVASDVRFTQVTEFVTQSPANRDQDAISQLSIINWQRHRMAVASCILDLQHHTIPLDRDSACNCMSRVVEAHRATAAVRTCPRYGGAWLDDIFDLHGSTISRGRQEPRPCGPSPGREHAPGPRFKAEPRAAGPR